MESLDTPAVPGAAPSHDPGATATDRVVGTLRELILHGELAPGARLGEVELAERLGVSRTPVREALSRLAAYGLVDTAPNRGARVATWTRTELEGVFDLRTALEPQLTALAVPRATPADLADLDGLARAMLEIGLPGPRQDLDALVPLNRRFHDRIVAVADHPALAGALAAAIQTPIQRRNFHAYDEPSLRRSLSHHVEIVDAFRAGDAGWAAAVMTAHIRNARAVMVRAHGATPLATLGPPPTAAAPSPAAAPPAPHPTTPSRPSSPSRRSVRMSYRLGVDVGGTFTDVLLVDETSGSTWRAKTASTPQDQAVGVLHGITRVCDDAGISLADVAQVLHGTTVATNAILEGKGATVGLVTTQGFRQVLQIARSYVPGGLAGWIIWPKPEPLAALENTVEVGERIASDGTVIRELDDDDVRSALQRLHGIEALAVSLINSFADPTHERRIRDLAAEVLPGIPVSLSSDVLPELREYERTVTTVANGYVQPQVKRYVSTLTDRLREGGVSAELAILRSDGGLSSAPAAIDAPVTMLLSGPAGGVTGAVWIAEQCGYRDLITFDMGGTSTDVALVQDLSPRIGRETKVGDLTVRASSVDVRTVGAGGGSIAHVPQLTKALRVGPQSAGADPGPAAYGKGGTEPTVTDANVVLGYLPSDLAGGEITLDADAARTAVATIADAMGLASPEAAAAGIVDIVNENMLGGLRLVSVQQGFDPRDFALVAFGGAGPLHANALGILTGAWPVIVPPSPGVLCALGDATTSRRDESARTVLRRFSDLTGDELAQVLTELAADAGDRLEAQGLARTDQTVAYTVDVRFHGQGFEIPVAVDPAWIEDGARDTALATLAETFDGEHQRLFGFLLTVDHELVNARATVSGPRPEVAAVTLEETTGPPEPLREAQIHVGSTPVQAKIYERASLRAGDVVTGPAIVTEMDSTTLVLPDHAATVHRSGSLLINPLTDPPATVATDDHTTTEA